MDTFWYFFSAGCFVLGGIGLLCVYRYFLGEKLSSQAQKLKSQIAKIRQDFPELDQKRSEIVADALGDIGINGIMDELGIDPAILKNPLVRGLIDKYAPRLMEMVAKAQSGENKAAVDQTGLL